jgi:pyruvate/2-oxoglutarate dehydrogenase complex dihydrolipoamide acyltransferase (E2) component
MSAFVIPQVPGSIPRSHPVDGIAESLVKSKKYLLPMAVLTPELTGGVIVAYLAEGRMKLPRNATIFNVDDEENGPGQSAEAAPAEPTQPEGDQPAADPVTAKPAAAPTPGEPSPTIE